MCSGLWGLRSLRLRVDPELGSSNAAGARSKAQLSQARFKSRKNHEKAGILGQALADHLAKLADVLALSALERPAWCPPFTLKLGLWVQIAS